jgi:hypothetical protein
MGVTYITHRASKRYMRRDIKRRASLGGQRTEPEG